MWRKWLVRLLLPRSSYSRNRAGRGGHGELISINVLMRPPTGVTLARVTSVWGQLLMPMSLQLCKQYGRPICAVLLSFRLHRYFFLSLPVVSSVSPTVQNLSVYRMETRLQSAPQRSRLIAQPTELAAIACIVDRQSSDCLDALDSLLLLAETGSLTLLSRNCWY